MRQVVLRRVCGNLTNEHLMKEATRRKQRPGTEHPPSEEKGRNELGKTIDAHLTTLIWSQLELATYAKVTQWQLSRWMTCEDPSIGRSHVCRLAYAIAGGYAAMNKDRAVPHRW